MGKMHDSNLGHMRAQVVQGQSSSLCCEQSMGCRHCWRPRGNVCVATTNTERSREAQPNTFASACWYQQSFQQAFPSRLPPRNMGPGRLDQAGHWTLECLVTHHTLPELILVSICMHYRVMPRPGLLV